jgi:hypothetical protein
MSLLSNIVTCWWLDTGFGLIIEFIRCLLFVTTNNYKTFTSLLHRLQITTPHSKSSQSAISSRTRCLVAASNNGDSLYCIRAQRLLSSTADGWWQTALVLSGNFLLVLATTGILGFGPSDTHDHIFQSRSFCMVICWLCQHSHSSFRALRHAWPWLHYSSFRSSCAI